MLSDAGYGSIILVLALFGYVKFGKYSEMIRSWSFMGIWMGLITSGLAFLELIYILVTYFRGDTVPGWASTLTVISFMFGILFILVGIIGAYLGRVLEILKNRPHFIVQDQLGFRDLP